MALTRAEKRQLRVLAEDLRVDNPRLARMLLQQRFGTRPRVLVSVMALVLSIGLLAIGSPIACFIAVLLDAVATLVLASD